MNKIITSIQRAFDNLFVLVSVKTNGALCLSQCMISSHISYPLDANGQLTYLKLDTMRKIQWQFYLAGMKRERHADIGRYVGRGTDKRYNFNFYTNRKDYLQSINYVILCDKDECLKSMKRIILFKYSVLCQYLYWMGRFSRKESYYRHYVLSLPKLLYAGQFECRIEDVVCIYCFKLLLKPNHTFTLTLTWAIQISPDDN